MSRQSDPEEVRRQVEYTRNRPLWVLPPSWWEPGVAEAMGEWIKRNVPEDERLTFTYGQPR